jgi:hypothetical protein
MSSGSAAVNNPAILSSVSARTWRGAFDHIPDLKVLCASCTVSSTSSAEAVWQLNAFSNAKGGRFLGSHTVQRPLQLQDPQLEYYYCGKPLLGAKVGDGMLTALPFLVSPVLLPKVGM